MERVNQLEKDMRALKNKVAKMQKRSKNGGQVQSDSSAPSAPSTSSNVHEEPAAETREKTGGIGVFLDNLFGSKEPEEKENEMRGVAGSLNQAGGGGARRKRKSRRNKKSRKNKRTGKRGGAKKNMRKNKKNKTRRNKNQRRRNSRRQQYGGA